MIDPQSIEEVQFKATRLKEGYDQDEVDAFLDRVADALRNALASNGSLEAEVQRLRRKVAELEDDPMRLADRLEGLTSSPTAG